MSKEIRIEDVELPVTDDPFAQRAAVLRTASFDVRTKNEGGRVAMIAKKIDKKLSGMQKKERWSAHQVVLALEHLTEAYCVTIYNTAIELEARELLKEEA